MPGWVLGVIGGSGLYQLPGLENARWEAVASPWGEPSDQLYRGTLNGTDIVFLPRHGRGHRLGPSQLNYRANIDVLKRAGCTDLISLSACGSLKESMAPGDFVIVNQFIDRTFAREKSFFGEGIVAHVSMAHPVSTRLSAMAFEEATALGVRVHRFGTYLAMEGPQFSTLAESKLYQSWGCNVIGMTNMPEAKLAREAELPYASIAMVTDYDCWREETEAVSVTDVLKVLHANAARAQELVSLLAKRLAATPRTPDPDGIDTCLDHAIITPKDARDPMAVARLDAVAGRVLS
ncbi:MAG TPA: S-methyl-5'-thioadenosine phosphorylase [Hyphomonadaceae bacterium]|jgi:5'-methylthioadenosine phosphorylase|nr:S-methyl-5'-thioadenosine phosphorylase [Hyphomonadaceae bacterium]